VADHDGVLDNLWKLQKVIEHYNIRKLLAEFSQNCL